MPLLFVISVLNPRSSVLIYVPIWNYCSIDNLDIRRYNWVHHNLPVLEVTEESEHLTEVIISTGSIPARAIRDAAHVAVAAVNNVDYLLTWNCKHLANAQIMRRLSVVCNSEGFNMPVICTPEELMGG